MPRPINREFQYPPQKKKEVQSVEYAYYPDGDIDPESRRTRIGLICEGGDWRIMGSSKTLSSAQLKEIREKVGSGRGEIFKIVSDSRRVDGRGDLLGGRRFYGSDRVAY